MTRRVTRREVIRLADGHAQDAARWFSIADANLNHLRLFSVVAGVAAVDHLEAASALRSGELPDGWVLDVP